MKRADLSNISKQSSEVDIHPINTSNLGDIHSPYTGQISGSVAYSANEISQNRKDKAMKGFSPYDLDLKKHLSSSNRASKMQDL